MGEKHLQLDDHAQGYTGGEFDLITLRLSSIVRPVRPDPECCIDNDV